MITALNLKYRPQKIKELDLCSAREALKKIFEGGKIPQAFLFTGPKGIGKTSAARIIAKAVNCQKISKNEYEPCGECSSCVSIANGTNLDVLEIDAASNRGIEDIRDLREKVKLAPFSAKFKVYIIDEAHMLTTEAFNALLKTLEEPPPHTLFILCTTTPEKLPETIVSRCTKINFKKASVSEIKEKLRIISQKEGFNFEDKDLEKIARVSEGSFRDAIKILEQSASSSVDEVIGTLKEFLVADLLKFLSQRQTKEAILWIGKAVEKGANLRVLTEEVLKILRENLLAKYGVEMEIDEQNQVKGFTEQDLRILIDLFSRAALELKNAVIPQLPLELAVIEWGEICSSQSPTPKKQEREEEVVNTSQSSSDFNIPNDEEVLAKWSQVLEKVKPMNHSVQAFLKASRPVGFQNDCLVLEVFYKFHKDQLENGKSRKIVEDACAQVFGRPIKVKFILCQKPFQDKKTSSTQTDLPKVDEDIIKLAEEIFGGKPIQ